MTVYELIQELATHKPNASVAIVMTGKKEEFTLFFDEIPDDHYVTVDGYIELVETTYDDAVVNIHCDVAPF